MCQLDASIQRLRTWDLRTQAHSSAHRNLVQAFSELDRAAAIYASCREMGASRSLKDVVAATDVKRNTISRSYRILVMALDIKVLLMDPMKCIAKIANKAKLSEKTKRMAMETMNKLVMSEISAGKLPMGLAATVLYMTCRANGENKTQKEIADIAGVTEVTIRNRIRDLKAKPELES